MLLHQPFLLVLLLFTSGCALPPGSPTILADTLPAPSTPKVASTVDWVDFIRFNGITYLASSTQSGDQLAPRNLGPQFAVVQLTVSENVTTPGYQYQVKDGDAAFLPSETPVYTVQGYRPEFRLAVMHDEAIVVYEADTNPQALHGSDLLDLTDKVQSIGINSAADGITELAVITDPQQVEALVEMVLTAPIRSSSGAAGDREYFVVFQLTDGTRVGRKYNLDTGALHRGILLPQAFADRIKTALEQTLPSTPDGK